MSATSTASSWTDHAFAALSQHGHRAGGARAAVVEALGRRGGCVDADELVGALRRGRKRVGVASVYRALGLLAELGLVQRVPVAGGSARYELVGPGGDHHHHLVCDDCGATTAFEDEALERAIGRLSRQTAYAVQAHDVTLHGTCPDCQRS
jgi:Fur family ferric uptake transcriptional regulator